MPAPGMWEQGSEGSEVRCRGGRGGAARRDTRRAAAAGASNTPAPCLRRDARAAKWSASAPLASRATLPHLPLSPQLPGPLLAMSPSADTPQPRGLTAADLLAHQAALEREAREAVPFSFTKGGCTHARGYIRQPVWACTTCGGGGVCAGCSVGCHAGEWERTCGVGRQTDQCAQSMTWWSSSPSAPSAATAARSPCRSAPVLPVPAAVLLQRCRRRAACGQRRRPWRRRTRTMRTGATLPATSAAVRAARRTILRLKTRCVERRCAGHVLLLTV
jgi:hypothetical protein